MPPMDDGHHESRFDQRELGFSRQMGTLITRGRLMSVESTVNRVADPPLLDDAELVLRAQRGDSEAFAMLVRKYQDRVYNTCYRMCPNHADALDLSQTAFLKAYQALPRFEARASFFTWLFRIVVNAVHSHRRARRDRPAVSLRSFAEEGYSHAAVERSGADDPADEMGREELRGRLEAALARLEVEFRTAVVLKDVEGLDYATIAEILRVPLGTVKSRICRGRQMLRSLLEHEERHREPG